MKITVVGLGYVGLSNAVILARHNEVVALEVDAARADLVNSGRSPIIDADLEAFLERGGLQLRATTDPQDAYADTSFVVTRFSVPYVRPAGPRTTAPTSPRRAGCRGRRRYG